jgi:hypothetical protein
MNTDHEEELNLQFTKQKYSAENELSKTIKTTIDELRTKLIYCG